MPIYKPNVKWLVECLKSLLIQSHRQWKLILSLDGDDEQTLEGAAIAGDMINSNNQLIVVSGVRAGIAKTLNRGLRRCDTYYTARLDSDDICTRKRLELQADYLDNDPTTIACGMQIKEIDEGSHLIGYNYKRYPTNNNRLLLTGAVVNNPIAHPTLMFRTNVVKGLDGYKDIKGMEDYDLISRIAEVGNISNLKQTGVYYRVHNIQISRMERPAAKELLKTRERFAKILIEKKGHSKALSWLPLALYWIGPNNEYMMRKMVKTIMGFVELALRLMAKNY